jgi:hypothetical protein
VVAKRVVGSGKSALGSLFVSKNVTNRSIGPTINRGIVDTRQVVIIVGLHVNGRAVRHSREVVRPSFLHEGSIQTAAAGNGYMGVVIQPNLPDRRRMGSCSGEERQYRQIIGALIVGFRQVLLVKLVVMAAFAYPAVGGFKKILRKAATREDVAAIRALVSAEEQILSLTPILHDLSQGLMNLQLPDKARRKWFQEGVEPLAGETNWKEVIRDIDWFDNAKFYIVSGAYKGANQFEAEVGMKGLARLHSGQWSGITAKQSVTWTKSESAEGEDVAWLISNWITTKIESVDSSTLWFKEALDEVLPRRFDQNLVRRSEHHEAAIEFYRDGAKRVPHPYFSAISANQKPGIAIADVDSDGDDDIYIMVRLGKNRLLENQGDGTFLEAAASHGLDIPGHSTCAIFADFDNDSDADLMLGRSLLPSVYMENTGGWFTKRELVLPKLAISMSAADFNRDGLLDLYIATYRPAVLGGSSPAGGVAGGSSNWPYEFLFPAVAKEYYRRHDELNRDSKGDLFPNLLNQIGPPNALLVNLGGGEFAPAKENRQLGVWRNTLQATWSDYDEDGDPDLYLANDWAPDHLFRNDGLKGFTDVTEAAGTKAFGFAMGATWGDYDNDGWLDLYVVNGYFSAPKEVASEVDL